MYKPILWQPYNVHTECSAFDIKLDNIFAEDMLETKISEEYRQKFQDKGSEVARFRGENIKEPYTFHNNSLFLRHINLSSNGSWLQLNDPCQGKRPNTSNGKPILYCMHNIDNSIDAQTILALFDTWVEYSQILKDIISK